jgi:chromosome segregation ATPase
MQYQRRQDEQRIMERDRDIEDLEHALSELKRDMQEEFRHRDKEAAQLQDKIGEAEECLKQALKGIQDKEQENESLHQALQAKSNSINEDSAKIASLEKTIVELEENNKRLQDLINEQICNTAQRYSEDCQSRLL